VDELPVLDLARITAITRGDRALTNEFLAALIEESDELLARLEPLLAGADLTAVSAIAHTLKGMATELGAQRLRASAIALESETQPQRWRELAAAVRTALGELRARAAGG
jgi:HPt (histidine-containing phosphotransfer) domain-containing protein